MRAIKIVVCSFVLAVSSSCTVDSRDDETSSATSSITLPPWTYEDPPPVVKCKKLPTAITYEAWKLAPTTLVSTGRNYVMLANAETNPQRVWAIGVALDTPAGGGVTFVMSVPKAMWGQLVDDLDAQTGVGGNPNGGGAVFGVVIATKLPGPIPDPTPGGTPPELFTARAYAAWNGITEDVGISCVP